MQERIEQLGTDELVSLLSSRKIHGNVCKAVKELQLQGPDFLDEKFVEDVFTHEVMKEFSILAPSVRALKRLHSELVVADNSSENNNNTQQTNSSSSSSSTTYNMNTSTTAPTMTASTSLVLPPPPEDPFESGTNFVLDEHGRQHFYYSFEERDRLLGKIREKRLQGIVRQKCKPLREKLAARYSALFTESNASAISYAPISSSSLSETASGNHQHHHRPSRESIQRKNLYVHLRIQRSEGDGSDSSSSSSSSKQKRQNIHHNNKSRNSSSASSSSSSVTAASQSVGGMQSVQQSTITNTTTTTTTTTNFSRASSSDENTSASSLSTAGGLSMMQQQQQQQQVENSSGGAGDDEDSSGEYVQMDLLPELVRDSECKFFLISGSAGSGKSTALMQLCSEQAFEDAILIFIPLRDLRDAKSGKVEKKIDSVSDLLHLVANKQHRVLNSSDIEKICPPPPSSSESSSSSSSSHSSPLLPVMFLLDSLDEVQHSAETDENLRSFLESFADPRNREFLAQEEANSALVRACDMVVVTSRPERISSSVYNVDSGPVMKWILMPWNSESVRAYCSNYFRVALSSIDRRRRRQLKMFSPSAASSNENESGNRQEAEEEEEGEEQEQHAFEEGEIEKGIKSVMETLNQPSMIMFSGLPLIVNLLCRLYCQRRFFFSPVNSSSNSNNNQSEDSNTVVIMMSPSLLFEQIVKLDWSRSRTKISEVLKEYQQHQQEKNKSSSSSYYDDNVLLNKVLDEAGSAAYQQLVICNDVTTIYFDPYKKEEEQKYFNVASGIPPLWSRLLEAAGFLRFETEITAKFQHRSLIEWLAARHASLNPDSCFKYRPSSSSSSSSHDHHQRKFTTKQQQQQQLPFEQKFATVWIFVADFARRHTLENVQKRNNNNNNNNNNFSSSSGCLSSSTTTLSSSSCSYYHPLRVYSPILVDKQNRLDEARLSRILAYSLGRKIDALARFRKKRVIVYEGSSKEVPVRYKVGHFVINEKDREMSLTLFARLTTIVASPPDFLLSAVLNWQSGNEEDEDEEVDQQLFKGLCSHWFEIAQQVARASSKELVFSWIAELSLAVGALETFKWIELNVPGAFSGQWIDKMVAGSVCRALDHLDRQETSRAVEYALSSYKVELNLFDAVRVSSLVGVTRMVAASPWSAKDFAWCLGKALHNKHFDIAASLLMRKEWKQVLPHRILELILFQVLPGQFQMWNRSEENFATRSRRQIVDFLELEVEKKEEQEQNQKEQEEGKYEQTAEAEEEEEVIFREEVRYVLAGLLVFDVFRSVVLTRLEEEEEEEASSPTKKKKKKVSERIWKVILSSKIGGSSSSSFSSCHHHELEELDLTRLTSQITAKQVISLIQSSPKLKKLEIPYVENIPESTVFCWPKLEFLALRNCDLRDLTLMSVASSACANLQRLDVCYNKNLTDKAISHVAANCPNLLELHVRGCNCLTDECIVKFLAPKCQKLEVLNVSGSNMKISDESLFAISRQRTANNNKKSREEEKEQEKGDQKPEEEKNSKKKKQGGNENFKVLHISWSSHVTDAGVAEIARNCSHFERLYCEDTKIAPQTLALFDSEVQLFTK